ncbi:hypothetical protein PHYPSEUDO_007821 [Phytophthora pseudosyringae]|uniref:Uncharacterized protein n=1 Tax=Phytophthora pseudosyringae TaxID=221518 RepID=A0A8T1VFU0_9STRA|nr:hypothetical protein PHYPSEUDO_007821 [Phytophthora pseudosyringae]
MDVPLFPPQDSTIILDLMNAVQSDVNTLSGIIGRPISSRARPGDKQSQTHVTTRRIDPQLRSDASDSAQEQEKKKRVYKKRKATHTVRKEEKLALEAEVAMLQTKLESLKLQALVQRGDEDSTLNNTQAHNAVLRDVVQERHLVMAQVQGMLLGCAQRHSYEVRPTEMFIHLTADRGERHERLKALRGPKLSYARRFIQQRSLGCTPRQNISMKRGNLTIREDEDLAEEDCSQLRLVTQTRQGCLVENNLVHFTDFSHAAEEGSYAVTTTDFVDEDDLYPYRPHERIRRDATAAILVTSHVDTSTKKESEGDVHCGNTSSKEEGKPVIVITRWAFTRIYHTELNVPHEVLCEMRNLSSRVSQTILNCVRESVGLPKLP